MRIGGPAMQTKIRYSSLLLFPSLSRQPKCKYKDSNDLVFIAFRDRLSTLRFQ